MNFARTTLVAALVISTSLSACGRNDEDASVRDGPQAVHPSPSALAATGLSYEQEADASAGYE